MGHGSIQVTAGVDGHLLPGANVARVDRLEALQQIRNILHPGCNLATVGKEKMLAQVFDLVGAGGETRTLDLGIMRPSLYL